MTKVVSPEQHAPDPNGNQKVLPAAAVRALEEAAQRRLTTATMAPTEIDGPAGKEPTRFGDWERKGIAYDF